MKTIEISDEIYSHLLSNTKEIGESASDILSRLLGITTIEHQNRRRRGFDDRSKKLNDFIEDPSYCTKKRAKDRYLLLLSKLSELDSELFPSVLEIGGRHRKYFGRDEEEIKKSGKSTYPMKIPNTNYWALTNISNNKKRDIIKTILKTHQINSTVIARIEKSI